MCLKWEFLSLWVKYSPNSSFKMFVLRWFSLKTRVCKFLISDCDKTSVGEFSITAVAKTTTTAGCSSLVVSSAFSFVGPISASFSSSLTSSIPLLSSCTSLPASSRILLDFSLSTSTSTSASTSSWDADAMQAIRASPWEILYMSLLMLWVGFLF